MTSNYAVAGGCAVPLTRGMLGQSSESLRSADSYDSAIEDSQRPMPKLCLEGVLPPSQLLNDPNQKAAPATVGLPDDPNQKAAPATLGLPNDPKAAPATGGLPNDPNQKAAPATLGLPNDPNQKAAPATGGLPNDPNQKAAPATGGLPNDPNRQAALVRLGLAKKSVPATAGLPHDPNHQLAGQPADSSRTPMKRKASDLNGSPQSSSPPSSAGNTSAPSKGKRSKSPSYWKSLDCNHDIIIFCVWALELPNCLIHAWHHYCT